MKASIEQKVANTYLPTHHRSPEKKHLVFSGTAPETAATCSTSIAVPDPLIHLLGIGWYAPEVERKEGDVTPGVYTSISPAWNDANLERITPKIVSPLVFAHVRAAMVGTPVVQMKCHVSNFNKGSQSLLCQLTARKRGMDRRRIKDVLKPRCLPVRRRADPSFKHKKWPTRQPFLCQECFS